MPHFHYQDNQFSVADLVDNSVLPYPHSIEVLFAHQLSHSVWAGVWRKLFDARDDSLLDSPGESLDLPACNRSKLYPVGHAANLETELFLERIQRNRPFLRGFLQSLLGILDVLAVLQRFQ